MKRWLLLLIFPALLSGQTLYRVSVASLVASQAADIGSSWGKPEANPAMGSTFGSKSVAVKSGIVAGSLLMQHFYLKKHPEKRKLFAWINIAASGVTVGVAIRNFDIKRGR